MENWFSGENATDLEAVPLGHLNDRVSESDLIVNTTSAGLHGSAALKIDWSKAPRSAVATDILYVPLMTPFLEDAAAAGLATIDGLGMLLHQAVPGFRQWFGKEPVVDDDLRCHLLNALSARN